MQVVAPQEFHAEAAQAHACTKRHSTPQFQKADSRSGLVLSLAVSMAMSAWQPYRSHMLRVISLLTFRKDTMCMQFYGAHGHGKIAISDRRNCRPCFELNRWLCGAKVAANAC